MLSIGLTCVTFAGLVAYYYKNENDLRWKDRPYKRFYTVYRPDDPRIENLKSRPAYYNPRGTVPDPLKKTDYEWANPVKKPVRADGDLSNRV